jgi:hypothetical protein
VNEKVIDPENGQIRPKKKEDVNAITVIDRKCFGAPRPEYYREKVGLATKGAGLTLSLL